MPTQIIVVKRAPRRFFAGPRALPDWLRSFWAAWSRSGDKDTNVGDSLIGLETVGRGVGPIVPKLDFDAIGAHRCNGCGLCLGACPSRCLSLTSEGRGAALKVATFENAHGRCIGCGVCREICPEEAILMSRGMAAESVAGNGRLPLTDLLKAGC